MRPLTAYAMARRVPPPTERDLLPSAQTTAAGTGGRAAVFLDKDGTLVENVPYNVDPCLLCFTPGAMAALQMLGEAGLPMVVVTNQPGLAQGRFTRRELARLQQVMSDRIQLEAGISLAGFFVCPHAPAKQGETPCLCRKPASGMLRQAAVAERYDLARSWMIGDILDDVEAGRRAGCRTILVDRGGETLWRLSPLRTPHYRCNDLLEAARIILSVRAREAAAQDATASLPLAGGGV